MDYPNTYKTLFETIVSTSSVTLGLNYELKSFFYGESRRIEEAMKSDIVYPALWAELPEYSYKERGDNMVKETSVAFVILAGLPVDNYDAQDEQIDLAIRIAEKIVRYFRNKLYFSAGDSIQIEPITTQMSDNCYGCRVTFTLKNQEADFLC